MKRTSSAMDGEDRAVKRSHLEHNPEGIEFSAFPPKILEQIFTQSHLSVEDAAICREVSHGFKNIIDAISNLFWAFRFKLNFGAKLPEEIPLKEESEESEESVDDEDDYSGSEIIGEDNTGIPTMDRERKIEERVPIKWKAVYRTAVQTFMAITSLFGKWYLLKLKYREQVDLTDEELLAWRVDSILDTVVLPEDLDSGWRMCASKEDIKLVDEWQAKLYWAIEQGHVSLVKYLLDYELLVPSDDYDPLLEALRSGHENVAIVLWHDRVLDQNMLEPEDRGADSYLGFAVRENMAEMCRILLEDGSDPNHESDGDGPILTSAVLNNNANIVYMLLEHGANVYGFDWMNSRPIHDVKSVEVLQLLLDYGAEDEEGEDGITLLMRLAEEGNVNAVKMLLSYGVGEGVEEALALAQEGQHHEIVALLQEQMGLIDDDSITTIVRRVFYNLNYGPDKEMKADVESAKFLAAVMEYIAAEVLERSGDILRQSIKSRGSIMPSHIKLGLEHDAELNALFAGFQIDESGDLTVVPVAAVSNTDRPPFEHNAE